MRVTEIEVPKGCSKLYVDLEDGKLVISYGSKANEVQVYCNETQRYETRPQIGEFSILWDNNSRNEAICACFNGKDKNGYLGSDGGRYDNAVRFRCNKQYLEIRGRYEELL